MEEHPCFESHSLDDESGLNGNANKSKLGHTKVNRQRHRLVQYKQRSNKEDGTHNASEK
jgi:ribosomal protein S15P/S13E